MTAILDVLIPTYCRPTALAITLTSLCAQSCRDFRVVISDQTEDANPLDSAEVQAVVRVLRLHGHTVETLKHLPRRGLAEQRQFLLEQVTAPYALYLDDDLLLEPDVLARLLTVLREERCGLVGSAVIGLSFLNDVRPHQQLIEFWDGPVEPEEIRPHTPQWQRHQLHNAANILHLQQGLGLSPEQTRRYRIAWVGGCVLYDTACLRSVGGFSFWRDLPSEHCGEDVLAQQRVMARHGGCGIIPSGVYHLELPTTVEDRTVNAPSVLGLDAVNSPGGTHGWTVEPALEA